MKIVKQLIVFLTIFAVVGLANAWVSEPSYASAKAPTKIHKVVKSKAYKSIKSKKVNKDKKAKLKVADHYIKSTGKWYGDGKAYEPTSGIDEYDWEIEHGMISEAREEVCRYCNAWAKYQYCPVCGEHVWEVGNYSLQY